MADYLGNQKAVDPMFLNGVFIGKDIEVAVTDNYIISYRRHNNGNFLESCLLKKDAVAEEYQCIGICRTSPLDSEMTAKPDSWEYAFDDRSEVFSSDQKISQYIGQPILSMENADSSFLFRYSDNNAYPAVQDELFDMADIRPYPLDISENNIGECLKLWNMGCKEEIFDIDGKNTFIGVTINTAKHMYIFEMLPSSIYCRAARYITCNKGIVFNQNFRQGVNAYMIEDNNEALKPLPVDESLFSSTACAWNKRSVYWSVSTFTDKQIQLHGCQGQIYKYDKPAA